MKSKEHKQAQKLATAVLALSVIFSSPAYAADVAVTAGGSSTTQTTAITGFSDVSNQHWAIKHITKLVALGIIQGFEKGEMRPENSVTQQDVIIMSIRMMGLESEALKNKADTILPFLVSDYAKPYVAYAIDRGLINIKEETDDTAAKTAWGSREATREWVAKLVIRAIGKQDLADQQSLVPSAFTDAKDMSSWGGGYVNAAVSLKIVQGMDGNTFQPKGKVTRAQMATFLSRADKELTTHSEKVLIGYVMELTDRRISVLNAQGETRDYTLSSDTVIFNAKDDSRIPLSTIKLTNEVYVIQNQGAATYIELTNDQQKLETIEGNLTKVLTSQMKVLLQQNDGEMIYDLSPSVSITDKDGKGLSLAALQTGSRVQLKRNTLLKEKSISQIVVTQVPVSKTAEGTVLSINNDQITFLEQSASQNETYSTASRPLVMLPDGSTADVTKLHVGDVVSYEVKANELIKVTVRKQAAIGQTVQGKLISLSADKQILTINKTGSTALEAYYIADNAIVSIDGLTNASLYDLEVNDELKLDLLNNKIIKATVTNRSVKQIIFSSILSYDADAKVLTITTESGDVGAYKMADSTTIQFGDAPIPLSNFQSMFTKGKKVDLIVSKDKVIQLQLTTKVDGTIAQINTTTNDLTIRTVGGQNLTFKAYSSTPVDMLNKTNGTLSDLKVGDQIQASIAFTQDSIGTIMTKKVGVYKTLITNANTRQVTVKDDTGSLLTFTIDSDDKIVNPNKTTHAFENIQIDDYVKASFNGSKLDKVVLLDSIRGKITSVDSTMGTITVQDAQGGVQVVPVGQQFTVKLNGGVSVALTSIKPNDRVEIVKDANDQVIIQVASSSKRVVSSYDVVLNQLILKPTAAGDKTTFNFFAKAYLHKGNQSVAANAFMENEEVMIYVLDDKIIEIEKP